MIVAIGSPAGAVVGDPDDLTRLHVQAGATDDARVDAALQASGLGYLEGGHAWLSVTALRDRGDTRPADWPSRFDAMIAYASGRGWCNADGTHVRAHVERTGGGAEA